MLKCQQLSERLLGKRLYKKDPETRGSHIQFWCCPKSFVLNIKPQ
jgi:hypothetical protein